MLRRLYRVALTIVAVLACALVMNPRDGARLQAVVAVTAIDSVAADHTTVEQAKSRSHHWRDRAMRRALKAVEVDIDDDDDPLCDVADEEVEVTERELSPVHVAVAVAVADPSRLSSCTGLPRGPPV